MLNIQVLWTCHICGAERPDALIGVLKKPLVIQGREVGTQNIRYCLDKPACREGAEAFSFVKEQGEEHEH